MSVEKYNPDDIDIHITNKAIQHFSHQLQQKGTKAIRFWIKESGCSGYMYELDFVDTPHDSDKTLTFDDLTLHIEQKAIPFLRGTEIDFVTEGVNQMIKFNNPNAKAMCGCGESFTV